MRYAILGLALLGFVHEASAQNYGALPVLRGSDYRPLPPTYRNWSGFYFGGQAGYSSANADYSQASASFLNPLQGVLVEGSYAVTSLGSVGKTHASSTPLGGFAGYNWQSDNAVYGVEFNYNRFSSTSIGATDSRIETAVEIDGYEYDITTSRRVSVKPSDVASMRLRGGVVLGQFLPYISLGVAAGRMSVTSIGSVWHDGGTHPTDPPVPAMTPVTRTEGKKGAIALGVSAGLGFDYEVLPHVFMRGEYEYLGFAQVENVKISIHTARAGIGLRF